MAKVSSAEKKTGIREGFFVEKKKGGQTSASKSREGFQVAAEEREDLKREEKKASYFLKIESAKEIRAFFFSCFQNSTNTFLRRTFSIFSPFLGQILRAEYRSFENRLRKKGERKRIEKKRWKKWEMVVGARVKIALSILKIFFSFSRPLLPFPFFGQGGNREEEDSLAPPFFRGCSRSTFSLQRNGKRRKRRKEGPSSYLRIAH